MPNAVSRPRPGASARIAAVIAALACTFAGSVAFAQIPPRFVVRGEAGAAIAIPDFQRGTLHQIGGVYLSARAAVHLFGPLDVQAGYDTYLLPSPVGLAQQHDVTGGLRINPQFWFGRIFADANAGAGITGGRVRLEIDFSVGAEFDMFRWVRWGPFVRYGHLFATGPDYPSDAQFVSIGVSLAVGEPTRALASSVPVRVIDRDHDGVADGADGCPNEPPGTHPDPQRPGCPLGDRDHDGVFDTDDACPDTAAGERPSTTHRGCPMEDSDSDGVLDDVDRCPTAPRGVHPDPARSGCPEGDRDGDGVVDSGDQCPDARPGLHPDPERPGCGLPDDDSDSVPDARDACRHQPGVPSTDPRRNGCPGLVRVEAVEIRILRPIFFDSNSTRIQPRSFPVLRTIAEVMRATPEIRRLSIEGHTDEAGDAAHNLSLSAERAHAVMGWLIRNGNVEPDRLATQGFGETRPLVPGHTREALAANRRVQFMIVDIPQTGSAAPPAQVSP